VPAAFSTGVQRATSLLTSFCRASGVRLALLEITPPKEPDRCRQMAPFGFWRQSA
jgi:hypothetical protein